MYRVGTSRFCWGNGDTYPTKKEATKAVREMIRDSGMRWVRDWDDVDQPSYWSRNWGPGKPYRVWIEEA
jgi:hypothetical protein